MHTIQYLAGWGGWLRRHRLSRPRLRSGKAEGGCTLCVKASMNEGTQSVQRKADGEVISPVACCRSGIGCGSTRAPVYYIYDDGTGNEINNNDKDMPASMSI